MSRSTNEPQSTQRLCMCDCARTREYCATRGCKRDTFEWRFSTEGRSKDRLRRVIDLRRRGTPVSRWITPERAISQAWVLNMEQAHGVLFIEKFGVLHLETSGVP